MDRERERERERRENERGKVRGPNSKEQTGDTAKAFHLSQAAVNATTRRRQETCSTRYMSRLSIDAETQKI